MSRVSKWKLEKNKVKVVFRLQFHATHIPQTGWDKLFISFIPADTGKATAKTTKANVRNGTCKWGDPIYETTRLLQDSKSKQYDEKLYKLVVSMGTSRASTLGEGIINLADYVDALKPSSVALPLQGCNFGTVLHITVQLLTSKTGFREFEQQRELRERGLQSGVDGHSPTGKTTSDQADKVSERIKLKHDASELSSFDGDGNLNEESADSATGFDGSSHTSGSLYAEKHEASSTLEIGTVTGDAALHCQSPHNVKVDLSGQNVSRESPGSAQGWGSDNSVDNEFVMVCNENNRLRGSLESTESSILNLKVEVCSLQSVADELGAETQKFSHLLASEISSSEKLEKEVSHMKSECQKLKDDIIHLKDLKLNAQVPITRTSDNQANELVRNVQLQFLNGITVVESKLRELQNKVFVVPHDGDAKLFYLELESLLNLLLNFKIGNSDVKTLMSVLPSEETDVKDIRDLSMCKDEQFVSGNGLGSDLCPPESILQHFSMNPAVSEVGSLGAIDAMKGQIFDLVRELDDAKVEKEALTRKMHQMECYYEALVQELEENQKRLLGELQLLRNEHSSCVYTITSSRGEIESLREDMNQQMIQFAEEKHNLDVLNKELERRATTSEAALRRARLNYSIAVDKLQKDLELLSSQVMSMFETNENLIKQALPSQPHAQGDLQLLQNPEDIDVPRSSQFQNVKTGMRKRSVGGEVLLEDLKRSFSMQEELYQKVEQELIEMYSINLNLDIYSKSLQEALREADSGIRIMVEKTNELEEELKLSTSSQNQLMAKLQKATDDIHSLKEFKSNSISQCSDMALQNQLLEDKLVSISDENHLLAQKLQDSEILMMEFRSYQTKYEACLAENTELSLQLKKEAFDSEQLADKVSRLEEELTVLKSESDKLVSFKESLEANISFACDKLGNLLESYNKQPCFGVDCQSYNLEGMDIKDAVLQLEKIQLMAYDKISELMEENQNLQSERDAADVSLSSARSEILSMRQRFRNDVQDMVTKLDLSNSLVEKLQAELESMASKIHLSSEIEEKYLQQSKVLLADLALLEDQMQELMSKNGHFAQDILGLDALAEEFGSTKLTIAELIHDKDKLTTCLQDKTEMSVKLSGEIDELKEDLKILHDKLQEEKIYKDELEAKVRDLTSHLDCGQNKVLIFEQEKAELAMCLQGKSEEINALKDDLQKLRVELLEEKACKCELEEQINALTTRLNSDQDNLHILEQEKAELAMFLQGKSAESSKLLHEMNVLQDNMQKLHDELLAEKACKAELETRVRDLTSHVNSGEESLRLFEQEKAELAMLLQGKSEDAIKLAGEISNLNKNLKTLHEELHGEKVHKDELEGRVNYLTSQLSKEHEKLVNLEQRNTRELTSTLELEKSRVAHLLHEQDVFIEKVKRSNIHQASLEGQLLEMCDYSLVVDVKLVYLTNQYEVLLEELTQKLLSSERCRTALHEKCCGTEAALNQCLAREADSSEEKRNLLISLNSLKSDLEGCEARNKLLSDSNVEARSQLEESNSKLSMMELRFSLNNILQACEVEWLKTIMVEAEEDINLLAVSKEELEILVTAFRGKFHELSSDATLLEEYRNELTTLRKQCTELSHKLSEQVLKTEELKNLSSHLKELKDKAEAECLLVRERRETEVQPAAAHDSLRIAFIKEQYETKVQELKQKLCVSQKHGEEMLMKLQDSINELETKRKSEAMNLKRIEELSVRLSALESELQSALAEKREKSNAYDRAKAELECAVLSLECCREEKEKLGSSLLEFEAEKSQLAVELTLVKEQLEKLHCFKKIEKDEYVSGAEAKHELNGSSGNSLPVCLDQDDESTCGISREWVASILDGEIADPTEPVQLQRVQIPEVYSAEESPVSNGKNFNVTKELLGVQSLKSSLEHLHEELEKMKSENIEFDNHQHVDSSSQVNQKEIMQLHKANEELRNMFPLFNEISGGGNALERVLALEIELAEALKAKSKLSIQFQSSFLKQHTDEEAVFKSFRDINELINEMLELKGRHAAMETELREMHDRYSQLSLQFAEVEGERQKLKMTLKNVRSRKLASLNRAASANATDQST